MAIHVEGRHTGEHIVSEASGSRSREQGMLAAGNLPPGAVLALDAGGDYIAVAPAAVDGTQVAVAVLYAATDASAAPVPCVVHARDCEVHGEALTWPDGTTEQQITDGTAALAAVGIIVR